MEKIKFFNFIYGILLFLNKKLWIFKIFIWKLRWKLVSKKHFNKIKFQQEFSIGVVTYVKRFDQFYKPLIVQLTKSFPGVEIIICVNGYYDLKVQEEFLKKILLFNSNFKNIKTIPFKNAQGLSKLWNLLVKNSSNKRTFILNDDLILKDTFSRNLINSNALNKDFTLINRSWSHFIIHKKIFEKVGDFDESFVGVGNEDEDYESRLVFCNINVFNIKINGLRNVSFPTKDFSYGKNTEVINKKYTSINQEVFNNKWIKSPIFQEGFKFVEIINCYVKPRKSIKSENT